MKKPLCCENRRSVRPPTCSTAMSMPGAEHDGKNAIAPTIASLMVGTLTPRAYTQIECPQWGR